MRNKRLADGKTVCATFLLLQAALGQQIHWVGTWAASPSGPPPDFPKLEGETIREIVHTTIGGNQAEVRFSNELGTQEVTIGAAHIAIRKTDSSVTDDHALTFNGRASITMPPGAAVVSDPVKIAVPAAGDLAISIYVPGPAAVETMHPSASQTSYRAKGDLTSAAEMPADARKITSWPFLSEVAVAAPAGAGAIVTFGDSITDGARSTTDKNARWPDVLARRLKGKFAVLNEGIGGNRILHEGTGSKRPVFGPNALSRFDRDVLAPAGVKYVIVLEGINDLGHPGTSAPASETVSAEDLMAGMRQMIERAHQHGVRVIGATILPFEGAAYYTAEKEAKRAAVNQWMRTSGAFDGVIDFDKATRDPNQPGHMLGKYDSGDHLHPNDAGYEAMGNAVDLALFR